MTPDTPALAVRSPRHLVSVGLDLVRVQDVADAIARFGDRYLARVFTPAEVAYCTGAPAPLATQRFAARFAAKEAVRKVLRPADAGIGWRDVEVYRATDGGPALRLHGAAAARAAALGLDDLAVSLTHESEWAAAVVTATRATPGPAILPTPFPPCQTPHQEPSHA